MIGRLVDWMRSIQRLLPSGSGSAPEHPPFQFVPRIGILLRQQKRTVLDQDPLPIPVDRER
jgi:hypothetical protein